MRKYELYSNYSDAFEYYGNNEILRVRKQYGMIVRRDWLVFNSTEEAMEHFNTKCGAYIGYYH
jgi:hypothetical protein